MFSPSRQLYETLFLTTRDLIKVVLVVLRDFPLLFLTRRYTQLIITASSMIIIHDRPSL